MLLFFTVCAVCPRWSLHASYTRVVVCALCAGGLDGLLGGRSPFRVRRETAHFRGLGSDTRKRKAGTSGIEIGAHLCSHLLHTCLCLVPAFVVPTPGPLPEEQGTIQTV